MAGRVLIFNLLAAGKTLRVGRMSASKTFTCPKGVHQLWPVASDGVRASEQPFFTLSTYSPPKRRRLGLPEGKPPRRDASPHRRTNRLYELYLAEAPNLRWRKPRGH